MRTTLDIDPPVLETLKELSRREGRSAGAVASDLIRRALSGSQPMGVRDPPALCGFRPFPAAGSIDPVTNEQVERLRDDLGI